MLLEINNLSFKYHNGSSIFQNVSFQLDNGEILSILGPNGCGK